MKKFFKILALVFVIVLCIYKTVKANKTIEGIEEMLDSAMRGEFSEKEFSEEKISKLESRFSGRHGHRRTA